MQQVLGGALIGLAAGLFMLLRGRIAGCSGLLFVTVFPATINKDALSFIIGLLISGLLAVIFLPLTALEDYPTPSYWYFFIGGILVGIGTYLGRGCTSGHGLCGLALYNKRSLVAVVLFFSIAILTATLIHGYVIRI